MFHLIVLNNRRVFYEGTVLSATLPGEEEEISILPFHRPLIGRLQRGTITAHLPSSVAAKKNDIRHTTYDIRIKGGIAHMDKNELVILVE